MISILWVAAGGALGSVCRYGVGLALPPNAAGFPWAIFAVNMLGCFLFGLLAELIVQNVLPKNADVPLLIGFLGGFTTFSSFGYNNYSLLENDRWGWLAFNLVAQNAGGIVLVMAGIALARYSGIFVHGGK